MHMVGSICFHLCIVGDFLFTPILFALPNLQLADDYMSS